MIAHGGWLPSRGGILQTIMTIDILTIFPDMLTSVLETSILKRAQKSGTVEIRTHDLRDWATDKHKKVDDRPFGGGPGMVLKVDVLRPAIQDLRQQNPEAKVVLLSPQGQTFHQEQAENLAQEKGLILVAGHYEGFDERVRDYVDFELSIGDYVLTGGELPAMVVIDSVVRLLPGVLGDESSASQDSFSDPGNRQKLDYPEYTQPREYDGKKVPEILLSGHHAKIEKWRQEQAEKKTKTKRVDA